MENSREGRTKSCWNSRGVHQKLRKKSGFPGEGGGGQFKIMENSRGFTVNLTGNPGGEPKGIDILNRGSTIFHLSHA